MKNWKSVSPFLDSFVFFSAVVLAGSPLSSLASSVRSPFALEVNSSTVNSLLSSSDAIQNPSGEAKVSIPDQEVQAPYEVNLKGITLDLKYAFQKPQPSADFGAWTIQSKDLSAELVVQHIDATQTIQLQQGGSTLNVRINAECTDVHLSLPSGNTHAGGNILFKLTDGKPSLALKDFSADWTPNSWTVTSMNCQGPNGFDQLVAQTASAKLRLIDPFLDTIRTQIENQLTALGSQELSMTFNVAAPDAVATPIQLNLKPTSFTTASDNRVILRGNAAFSFSAETGGDCDIAPGKAFDPSMTEIKEDVIVFPFDVVNNIVTCAYKDPTLRAHVTSDDISFFDLLVHSPVGLFIWPDLLRFTFDLDAVFGFDLGISDSPFIGTPSSQTAGTIDVDMKLPIDVAVSTPSNEKYVDFKTSLNGLSHWLFEGNKVTITQDVENPKIQPTWDPEYVQKHHPFEEINTSVVSNELKSFLHSPGLTYNIPDLEIAQALRLSTDGVSLQNGNLYLGLKIEVQK